MPVAVGHSIAFPAQVSQSGSFTSGDIQNPGCTGVKVVLNVTGNPGGLGSLVLTIQGKDQASGTYYVILLQSAALSAAATTVGRSSSLV
jgi:hypothetical protein